MSGGLSILLQDAQDDGARPEDTGQQPTQALQPASAVLGITLQGGQKVSLGEQVTAAGRMAVHEGRRRLNEIRGQRGGLLNHLENARAPSIRQQSEYAQGRSWVPPGHDRGYMEAHGVLFHAVIGRPGVALGQLIAGIHHRPIVWCPVAFFAFALTLTGLCVAHETIFAVVLGFAVAVLAVAWCLAAEAVRRHLNPQVTSYGDDGDTADAQPHADA